VLKFHSLSRKRTIVGEKHEKNSLFLVSLLAIVVAIAPFYLKTLEVSGQTKFLYTILDQKIKMNSLEDLDEINEIKLP